MPRGEWDDNTWYDDGDFPPVSKNEGRGGLVTAGVFSILMSAFNALAAAGFLCCSGFCALVAADQGGFNLLPAQMVQFYVWGGLGLGSVSGIAFFLQLFAGLSLFRGRSWARTTTLWLAGVSILVAAGLGSVVVYEFVNNGGDEDAEKRAVVLLVAALVHATYAIVEYSVLLQKSVARRFR